MHKLRIPDAKHPTNGKRMKITQVRCEWIEDDGTKHETVFPADALDKWEGEPGLASSESYTFKG